MEIKANFVDIDRREIYPVKVVTNNQKITSVTKIDERCSTYILPGFIDAHIHIESSMLPPSEFARLAVRHGTVATVSDPHEIANVLGIKGVEFMLNNAEQVNFKFYFGASPCVPATSFIESAAGVEEGGRTGLSAVVVGLLFILPLFLLPFFKAIPPNAIYPILIVIGVMMFSEVKHIDYQDPAIKYSTFFIVMGMPLMYSITNGLLLGALVFVFINLLQGKYKQIDIAMGVLAAVALLVFFVL